MKMTGGKIILVLDVGATNVRSIAVGEKGYLLASHSLPNTTGSDPFYPGGRIWDTEQLWTKLKDTMAAVLKEIRPENLAGVTVTTFGVDGAPVKKTGELVYPVISWQCERTAPVMESIGKYIALEELFRISGLQPFSFNTINKLVWLKENRPEALEKADWFAFLPSIFLHRLTGEWVTDTSMAGTSMLTGLENRNFSKTILDSLGLDTGFFPPVVEPGTMTGRVTPHAARETGLPAGLPVIATGHDTQFAVFGSGAGENQPVLSSGTWEILMVRARRYNTRPEMLEKKLTTELDPVPGLYNIGVQWIGSGMIEWIRNMFYGAEKNAPDIYDLMISEAMEVPAGSGGVMVFPAFFPDPGSRLRGGVLGLSMNTPRSHVYRSALEALALKTKESLGVLEQAGGFTASSLICVGGGSKNKLLNQIRADVLNIPVHLTDQKETTVLGAALFTMAGAGMFASAMEAREQVNYRKEVYDPRKVEDYRGILEEYDRLNRSLGEYYRKDQNLP